MGGVIISPNIKREAVRINPNGDVIDPRTKQVIQENKLDYIPTKQEIEAQINAVPLETLEETTKQVVVGISIKDQIIAAEKHLADLKVLRKAEIERMKAELASLEADE